MREAPGASERLLQRRRNLHLRDLPGVPAAPGSHHASCAGGCPGIQGKGLFFPPRYALRDESAPSGCDVPSQHLARGLQIILPPTQGCSPGAEALSSPLLGVCELTPFKMTTLTTRRCFHCLASQPGGAVNLKIFRSQKGEVFIPFPPLRDSSLCPALVLNRHVGCVMLSKSAGKCPRKKK